MRMAYATAKDVRGGRIFEVTRRRIILNNTISVHVPSSDGS